MIRSALAALTLLVLVLPAHALSLPSSVTSLGDVAPVVGGFSLAISDEPEAEPPPAWLPTLVADQTGTIASSVRKKRDDTSNAVISKI